MSDTMSDLFNEVIVSDVSVDIGSPHLSLQDCLDMKTDLVLLLILVYFNCYEFTFILH